MTNRYELLALENRRKLSYYYGTNILTLGYVFFFQAEDGIRDVAVTGVQTCALPILEHDPERKDVRPMVDGRSRHLLGGHVSGRAEHDAGARLVVGDAHARDPEVHDFHPPARQQHDVARLDVAVDDAALVRVAEAVGHLLGDIDRLDGGDRALQHPGAELDSLEKLHRHVGEVVFLPEIVDGDDMGMRELARGLGFEEETLVEFLAPFRVVRKDDGLQRDDAVESRVLGLVDDPHRAAAQLAEDLVAADLGQLLLCHRTISITSPRTFSPCAIVCRILTTTPSTNFWWPSADTRAATPAPTSPITAVTLSARKRVRLRSATRPSGLNSSWVRSPASVKTPAGKTPDSSPGEASAMASRKDRDISRREGEANSATLAATAMPSPIIPSSSRPPGANCTAP